VSPFVRPRFSDDSSNQVFVESDDFPVHLLDLNLVGTRDIPERERDHIPTKIEILLNPTSVCLNDSVGRDSGVEESELLSIGEKDKCIVYDLY
jgi:hypothetical protein